MVGESIGVCSTGRLDDDTRLELRSRVEKRDKLYREML